MNKANKIINFAEEVLFESSFSKEDIPDNFILVFELMAGSSPQDTVKKLLSHELRGVAGISDTSQIISDFLGVGRDAVLLMDGKETVKLNKLSRILYNNPDYLVSNNFKALLRLYELHDFSIKSIFVKIFDQLGVAMKNAGKKGFEDSLSSEYYPALTVLGNAYKLKKPKIQNYGHFYKWVMAAFNGVLKKDSPDLSTYTSDRARNKVLGAFQNEKKSIKILLKDTGHNLKKYLREAVSLAAGTYAPEGEWDVKNNSLKIPKGSKIIMSIPATGDIWTAFLKGIPALENLLPSEENVLGKVVSERYIKDLIESRKVLNDLSKSYKVEPMQKAEHEKLFGSVYDSPIETRNKTIKARFHR